LAHGAVTNRNHDSSFIVVADIVNLLIGNATASILVISLFGNVPAAVAVAVAALRDGSSFVDGWILPPGLVDNYGL